MSRTTLVVGFTALALAAAPAFAQTAAKPPHAMHTSAHKMSKPAKVNPDTSADQLNAKELSTIQSASSAPMPAAPKKMP
jgi:hypothetical protein